jgi:hypothetical protein
LQPGLQPGLQPLDRLQPVEHPQPVEQPGLQPLDRLQPVEQPGLQPGFSLARARARLFVLLCSYLFLLFVLLSFAACAVCTESVCLVYDSSLLEIVLRAL